VFVVFAFWERRSGAALGDGAKEEYAASREARGGVSEGDGAAAVARKGVESPRANKESYKQRARGAELSEATDRAWWRSALSKSDRHQAVRHSSSQARKNGSLSFCDCHAACVTVRRDSVAPLH